MDIVERLRDLGDLAQDAYKAANEIERLRNCEVYNARSVASSNAEIERLRGALEKIAAVDDERLPDPSTPEEAVLWSTLGACVDLARKALGGE